MIVACGERSEPVLPRGTRDGTVEGPLVRVTFVDAVISLSNREGVAWDSNDVVPPSLRADLRVALVRPNPYGRVLELIAAHEAESWGKPDPRGRVMLLAPSCAPVIRVLPTQRDTYRPRWEGGITFPHVALHAGARFRVVLDDDDDPGAIDPIGAVDITVAELDRALAANGAIHQADVSNQREPILFVGIIVAREVP
jgi:hypothetical protein